MTRLIRALCNVFQVYALLKIIDEYQHYDPVVEDTGNMEWFGVNFIVPKTSYVLEYNNNLQLLQSNCHDRTVQ